MPTMRAIWLGISAGDAIEDPEKRCQHYPDKDPSLVPIFFEVMARHEW
jgi:hypothetical protein